MISCTAQTLPIFTERNGCNHAVNDGQMTGKATVKQTAFGIKPYSALFGTLKVADDVRIEIDAKADQDSL